METFPGVVMVNSVDESGTLASTSDVMDGNVAVLSYGANVLKPINYVAEGDNRVGNGGTSTAPRYCRRTWRWPCRSGTTRRATRSSSL